MDLQEGRVLSYSVRFSVVIKYLGLTSFISVFASLIPFLASLIFKEFDFSMRFAEVTGFFLIVWLLTLKIPQPNSLQSNEAYVIIALTFILGSLVMVYPLMNTHLSFTDAWFEAISGITTTGLTVADLGKIHARSFFFLRSWMQWYGGFGIVAYSLGLAFQPSSILMKFFKKDYVENFTENSFIYVRKMTIVYCILTIVGFIWLRAVGLHFFDAINFTFSSISTGGFSRYPDSLASLSFPVQISIIFLAFLGAISFPLFWITNYKDLRKLMEDTQLHVLVICCLISTICFVVLFAHHLDRSFLNTISLQTTTGFTTFNLSELNSSMKLIFVGSMLIGGSTHSTAGGLKILRLVIILKAFHALFFRTTLPRHAVGSYDSERVLKETNICLCLFAFYVLVAAISTWIFTIMGYPLLDSLFDVVSATGTVGASSGVTGPNLPTLLKYVLGANMLLGRLEIITLLVLFYPRTLFGRRMQS